jgi:hypothetical protein
MFVFLFQIHVGFIPEKSVGRQQYCVTVFIPFELEMKGQMIAPVLKKFPVLPSLYVPR